MKRENSHCDGLSLLELLHKGSVNTGRVVLKTTKEQKARKKLLLCIIFKGAKKEPCARYATAANVPPPHAQCRIRSKDKGEGDEEER